MHMKCSLHPDVHARERGGTAESPSESLRSPQSRSEERADRPGQPSVSHLTPVSHLG